MSLVTGKFYKIRNSTTGKMLNVYSSGNPSNGTNVVLYTDDGSAEQKWKILSTSGGYKLQCQDGTKVLDRYTVSGSSLNNADVWDNTTGDNAAQIVQFYEAISGSGTDLYRIKLVSNGYYLSSYGSSNGTGSGKSTTSVGNVFWKSTSGQQNIWQFIDLDGGSGGQGNGTLTEGVRPTTLNYNGGCYTSFSAGQCTWHAHGRAKEVKGKTITFSQSSGLNAARWWDYVTNCTGTQTATSNSIAVWDDGDTGHVAYVEKVSGDNVYITEANWPTVNDTPDAEDGKVKILYTDLSI